MIGYPIQLEIRDMRCVVFGGGRVAYRKVTSLIEAGACVTVVSPALCDGLERYRADEAICHIARGYEVGDETAYRLIICATDDPALNRTIARRARAQGALVNVIDEAEEGNFTVPSKVAVGDLLLTVSTGGISPAFARMMRRDLEARYHAGYGAFLARLGAWRDEVKTLLPTPSEREAFWRTVLTAEVMKLLAEGKQEEAEESVENAISSIRTQS